MWCSLTSRSSEKEKEIEAPAAECYCCDGGGLVLVMFLFCFQLKPTENTRAHTHAVWRRGEKRLGDCRPLMTPACCIPLRIVSVSLWTWFRNKEEQRKRTHGPISHDEGFFHALSIFSYLFRGPRFVCLGVVLICVHLFTHNLLLFHSTFQPEGRVKR